MTVAELIRELESMPQNVCVYAEGKPCDKVILENCQGDLTVRIGRETEGEGNYEKL